MGFIKGGTGFFRLLADSKLFLGQRKARTWLLSCCPHAQSRVILKECPHLANTTSMTLHIGRIRDFTFPEGYFSHIIRAATEASAAVNDQNPLRMFNTIVHGTPCALDFAVHCGAKKLGQNGSMIDFSCLIERYSIIYYEIAF